MATWPGGNNLASAYWNRLNGSFTIGTWTGGYNGLAYDPVLNPLGFDNNGHFYNFVPCLVDIAEVATEVASLTQQAAVYASTTFNQNTSWNPTTPLAATYVNTSTFTVVGNQVSNFLPNGMSGRALLLMINGLPVYANVATAAYSTLTTVTITTGVLTNQLTTVQYGQDPNNAPLTPPTTGSTLFLAQYCKAF